MPALPKPASRAAERKDKRREKEKQWARVRQCVLVRDGYRCRRCKSREQVDAHHIKFRSAGGKHTVENVAALCRICHDDVHAYRLSVSGNANKSLRFEVLQ